MLGMKQLSLMVLWVVLAGFSDASAAVFTVNSNSDAGDNAAGDGSCYTGAIISFNGSFQLQCTLRAAIEESNQLPGADTIEFSPYLPTTAGVVEFLPQSGLVIDGPLTLDGYTAPGYNTLDPNETPVINIDGSQAPSVAGLHVEPGSHGTVIRGLAIHSFATHGIVITADPTNQLGSNNVVIQGNHIGIQRSAFYRGNGSVGIAISRGSNDARIGMSCNASGCGGRGNIISANGSFGLLLMGGDATVHGNRIGTDIYGSSTFVPFGGATANGRWGIMIGSDATFTTIGTADSDAMNVISGNGDGGIAVSAGSFQTTIAGNRIGTNLAGTAALGNQGPGIRTSGGATLVGGPDIAAGNLISGNDGPGIEMRTAPPDQAVVQQNTVGLNAARDATLPNHGPGVLAGGSGDRVEENLIGGNTGAGVEIEGDYVVVFENRIGANFLGAPFPNQSYGVHAIGIAADIIGNRIGHNELEGIRVEREAILTEIYGNAIGAFYTRSTNGGIEVVPAGNNAGITSYARNTSIGRSQSSNVIGHNQTFGIYLADSAGESRVRNNFVGVDSVGRDIGNGTMGIFSDAEGADIGASLNETDAQTIVDSGNRIGHNPGGAIIIDQIDGRAAVRGNQFLVPPGVRPEIDLGWDGPTTNDFGDTDTGPNQLQNYPEFELSQTQYDEEKGELEIRYRVDSNTGDSVYPLTIDFYLRNDAGDGLNHYLGTDTYDAQAATNYRNAVVDPYEWQQGSGGYLYATATDADGRTSEVSTQLVPVPEPEFWTLLFAGVLSTAFRSEVRRARNSTRRPPSPREA